MSCTLMQVKIVEKYFYFSSTDFEYKCHIITRYHTVHYPYCMQLSQTLVYFLNLQIIHQGYCFIQLNSWLGRLGKRSTECMVNISMAVNWLMRYWNLYHPSYHHVFYFCCLTVFFLFLICSITPSFLTSLEKMITSLIYIQ